MRYEHLGLSSGTIEFEDGPEFLHPTGARSKMTLELDPKGRGVGVLFAPLARKSARKDIPKSHRRLKEILERER